MLERLEVWRCFFAYGYGYRSDRLIQLYQVVLFYCSQTCLKYFKIMHYIKSRHTRQIKKMNFILLYPDKHSQQQKLIQYFQQDVIRHTQSSLSCKFSISVALLIEIANSPVPGIDTENILYLFFADWGTAGSCLIFTFHLSF